MRLVLLLLLSGCASVPHYESVQQARQMIAVGDMKAIEWLFSNQVNYFRDYYPEDEYRDSDDTLKLGLADCDDYYQVTHDIISSWKGYLVQKDIKLMPSGKYHVTAVVIGPDVLGEFDNGKWKPWKI